jgi:hypothetical protein
MTRVPLRLVRGAGGEPAATAWFCAACGTAHGAGSPPPFARTCSRCVTGLLLEAAAALAPGRDGADGELRIRTLSPAAHATELWLRPANTFGLRIAARVGRCGPPPGAVIVLDQPHRRRSRGRAS